MYEILGHLCFAPMNAVRVAVIVGLVWFCVAFWLLHAHAAAPAVGEAAFGLAFLGSVATEH